MSAAPAPDQGRAWLRAAALFLVALVAGVAHPVVIVGLPLLALVMGLGARRFGVAMVAILAGLVTFTAGARDGVWYLERGWALLLGGCFAAATLRRPSTPFTPRALAAVGATGGAAAIFFGMRSGAWASVDWVVRDRMADGVRSALDAMRLIRGGEALSPSLVATIYQTVEAQSVVFPALLGLTSMAGLGVAWWMYRRLAVGDRQALGPVRDFRFNDHLVWLFIGGLALLVLQWGAEGGRLGANAVVFMGALYALRGAAVVVFLSGGVSLLGYAVVAFGLLFVPPLILTMAMVVGIGDTWIDVRTRVDSTTA